MKPNYLQNIPPHWEIIKLKYLTTKIIDGTHFTPNYIDAGVPFLRVTDIQTPEINLENVKRISQEEHEQLTKRCKPAKNDVLLSKNGTIGITKVVDWDWEFSIFVSVALLKFTPRLNPYFFSYFFESHLVTQQIHENSKTTSVTNLHLDKIKELKIYCPPLSEQIAIAEYLDQKTAQIDAMIAKNELIYGKSDKKTGLLTEYRQSLISEAVSGQLNI